VASGKENADDSADTLGDDLRAFGCSRGIQRPVGKRPDGVQFRRQWETNTSLTQAETHDQGHPLDRKIHGKQGGVSATLRNPASSNSSTLTLIRVFARNGQRCEQIDCQFGWSNSSDRYLVSCLQPDGAWKLAY